MAKIPAAAAQAVTANTPGGGLVPPPPVLQNPASQTATPSSCPSCGGLATACQCAQTQASTAPYQRTTTDKEIFDSLMEKYSSGGPPDDGLEFEEVQARVIPPSKTTLVLDKWSLRRGKEIAEEFFSKAEDAAHDIGRSQGFISKAFKDAMPTNEDPMYDPYLQADMHSVCFEPEYSFAENPEDRERADWLKQLTESPDFQSMHNECQLDDTLSTIACESIAQKYVVYRKEEQQRQCQGGNQPGGGGGGGTGNGSGGAPGGNGSGRGMGNGQYIRQAISASQAVKHARQEVSEARDAMSALGNDMLKDDVQAIFKAIRRNPNLKKIVEMAGRYRRLAQTKQRQKSIHGMEDVAGITIGGDVERLIPQELAMLSDDELELDAMRRISERQAMEFQFSGFQAKDKGPIIVTVDESGSMSGDRIANAKALAMAMAWVAKSQKRWCALVAFSGSAQGRWVALPPDGWDAQKMLDWVAAFDGGGTVPDVPLSTVPFEYFKEMGAPKGKTDMITITDGGMGVCQDMIDKFNAWKKEEKCLHFLVIIDDEPGDLEQTCDKLWKIKSLSLEEDCVSQLVSI